VNEVLAPLGLGTWAFGADFWHNQQRSDSIKALHAAIRYGITHYDTAQGYGKGASEQLVGQQLRRFRKEFPRASYLLASKVFLPAHPDQLEEVIKRSLRRLCTSYLDILYIHWPDSTKDINKYLVTCDQLRKKGLFLSLGVSNFPLKLLEDSCSITEISYCQMPVSLLWTKALKELYPFCSAQNITMVGYSPMGLGLLSGTYRNIDDFDTADRRRTLFPLQKAYREQFHDLLDALQWTANRLSTSMALCALLWARRQNISTVLFGARNRDQVSQAITTDSIEYIPEDFHQVETAAAALAHSIPSTEDNLFFHRW
jgi:aryl-alcohol dehydrogenase-like predicted oxidoreductase